MSNQRYYEVVAEELQRRSLRPGLWARAVAETSGEGEAARAFYIRLRVAELGQIEKADRAIERARVEKEKLEEQAKGRAKQRALEARKFQRWTKCPQCAHEGSMLEVFWTLSFSIEMPVKCPMCKCRFNWYDYPAA